MTALLVHQPMALPLVCLTSFCFLVVDADGLRLLVCQMMSGLLVHQMMTGVLVHQPMAALVARPTSYVGFLVVDADGLLLLVCQMMTALLVRQIWSCCAGAALWALDASQPMRLLALRTDSACALGVLGVYRADDCAPENGFCLYRPYYGTSPGGWVRQTASSFFTWHVSLSRSLRKNSTPQSLGGMKKAHGAHLKMATCATERKESRVWCPQKNC